MQDIRIAILTVSDRSSRGERPDLSGPALMEVLQAQPGFNVEATGIVSDDSKAIADELIRLCDEGHFNLVFTSGGTGLTPRDNTPEVTLSVAERQVPGIGEAMRADSLKITPMAAISRGVAVTRGKTMIINLPGKPKAAVENLQAILPVLAHAVEMLRGENTDHG